ncbi:MAG: hypothetical protein ACSLFK_10530 [Gemmatimonadaceae bacterium]
MSLNWIVRRKPDDAAEDTPETSWGVSLRAMRPYWVAFLSWFILSVGIGGITVWDQLFRDWRVAFLNGSMGVLLVVLLMDALGTNILLTHRSHRWGIEQWRTLAGAAAFAVIAVQSFVMQRSISETRMLGLEPSSGLLWGQLLLLGLAIAICVYLHSFRFVEFEQTADAYDKRESQGVMRLIEDPPSRSEDIEL